MKPIIKWAGGKRQLLGEILPLFPEKYERYIEPFIGGGAVLFAHAPRTAIVNDLNSELINLYTVIKSDSDSLISVLSTYKNEKEFFYEIRNQDREKDFKKKSRVERAARFIFLNRTCFNGLYRVNSRGEFNVPYGKYKSPIICNKELIKEISKYFNENDISFYNVDFEEIIKKSKQGDFIYLDPPYDPISETSSFTAYDKNGFDKEEQLRLRDALKEADERCVKWLLSNSATDFIKDIYNDWNVVEIDANRNINSKGDKRGKVKEVLIKNY